MPEYHAFTVECYRCGATTKFNELSTLMSAINMEAFMTVYGLPGVICGECYAELYPMQQELLENNRKIINEKIEIDRENRLKQKVTKIKEVH